MDYGKKVGQGLGSIHHQLLIGCLNVGVVLNIECR